MTDKKESFPYRHKKASVLPGKRERTRSFFTLQETSLNVLI